MSNVDSTKNYPQPIVVRVPNEKSPAPAPEQPKTQSFGNAPSYGEGSYERGQEGLSAAAIGGLLAAGIGGTALVFAGLRKGKCTEILNRLMKDKNAVTAEAKDKIAKEAAELADKEGYTFFGLFKHNSEGFSKRIEEEFSEKLAKASEQVASTAENAAKDAPAVAEELADKTAEEVKKEAGKAGKKAAVKSREDLVKIERGKIFPKRADEDVEAYVKRFCEQSGSNYTLFPGGIIDFGRLNAAQKQTLLKDLKMCRDAAADNAYIQNRLKEIKTDVDAISTGYFRQLCVTSDKAFDTYTKGMVKGMKSKVKSANAAKTTAATDFRKANSKFSGLFPSELRYAKKDGDLKPIYDALREDRKGFLNLISYANGHKSYSELCESEAAKRALKSVGKSLSDVKDKTQDEIKALFSSTQIDLPGGGRLDWNEFFNKGKDVVDKRVALDKAEAKVELYEKFSSESGWREVREEIKGYKEELETMKETIEDLDDKWLNDMFYTDNTGGKILNGTKFSANLPDNAGATFKFAYGMP